MNQTRIFLDTNVLVYAHDASSQHHIVSADLLTAVFAGQFQAVLAEQNLIELYRILTNPVAMKGKPLLDLAVQKNITSAKIFDLRLAAIALSAQVKFLVTFNIKDFTGINGLIPLSPDEIFTQPEEQ